MKKLNALTILVITILFFNTQSSIAACADVLSKNDTVNGQTFTRNFDLLREQTEDADTLALLVFKDFVQKLYCDDDEIFYAEKQGGDYIKKINITCSYIVPQLEVSRVCYIDTPIGFFFIMPDMQDDMNIVYNRWD